MLKILLYVFGGAAIVYLLFTITDDQARKTALTNEFITITQEVCLPVLQMEGQVETQSFRRFLQSRLPDTYSFEDDEVKTIDGNVCGQYRIKKQGGLVNIAICQDVHKKMKCSMGLGTKPYSLIEQDYINALPEFSGWEQGQPNANRRKGEYKTPFSRFLCRPALAKNRANAITIMQMRSMHNVGVTIYESPCETLGKVIE